MGFDFARYQRERRAAGKDKWLIYRSTPAYRYAVKRDISKFAAGEGACLKCDWRPMCPEEWSAMDFHHRDPATKKFQIAGSLLRSFKSLSEEAAKCDLLCARCHRIHHAEQGTAGVGRPKLAAVAS